MKPFATLRLLLVGTVSIAIWLYSIPNPAISGNSDSDIELREEREQLSDAFSRSELVILGTVVDIQNYLPTDGGYSYEIAVSEVLKGAQADRYSLRAVGWTYTIPFSHGEEVLLFLSKSDSLLVREPFVVALDSKGKPLAFRIEAGQLVTVTPPDWRSSLESYSLEEVRKIASGDTHS
ncbi:MAG: hypothetical protein F6K14_13155 [Symploca sp. SIO2C1]|nr:hypothetical protein [Symploca sp. SIO2C1]